MQLAFELEQGFYFSHRDKQQKRWFQPTQTKPLFKSWLFLPIKSHPALGPEGLYISFHGQQHQLDESKGDGCP